MGPIVILFCLAAAGMVLAQQVAGLAGIIAGLFATIFLAAGILSLADFLGHSFTRGRKEWNTGSCAGELALVQARFAFARLVAGLTPEQLEALGKFQAMIEIDAQGAEPEYYLKIGEDRFKWAQVQDFINQCTETHLCPIGYYSEGSPGRRLASAVTGFLAANGHVQLAAGNRPAQWVDRAGGLRSLGVEE